jgi:hypothetical protein
MRSATHYIDAAQISEKAGISGGKRQFHCHAAGKHEISCRGAAAKFGATQQRFFRLPQARANAA